MTPETTHKAWGGALAALAAATIPIILSVTTQGEIEPGQLGSLTESLVTIAGLAVSALVGFVGVYFAPRNQPKEVEE